MPMTTSVATALTNGLHGIAAIALAWLALSLALCLVEAALTGSIRITGRFAPGFVRRLVAVMLGMSSVLGGVSNGLIISQAAEPLPQPIPGSATGSAVSPMVALLAGLPLPERPVLDPGPSTPRAPAANAEPGSSYGSGRSDGAHREAVTVRTGDSCGLSQSGSGWIGRTCTGTTSR